MKKFYFKQEKILRLRVHSENEAKMELGRLTGILAEIENNIRSIAEERIMAAANQFLPENSALDMLQYSYYIARLDSTKEKLLHDAAMMEIKIEEARAVYMEASRERKIMDKLKEKQQMEYRKEYNREEAKTLDELSSVAYSRR